MYIDNCYLYYLLKRIIDDDTVFCHSFVYIFIHDSWEIGTLRRKGSNVHILYLPIG